MSKFSQSLNLNQSQSLVMTPQLQQAIKLLQLNNMELAEFVEEELADNPLLEKVDPTTQTDDGSNADDSGSNEPEKTSDGTETPAENDTEREFEPQDFDTSDFDPGSKMADMGSGGNHAFDDVENSFENRMSADKTLREHLSDQLFLACDDPRDRMIGGLLIDQLDEAGYLRGCHKSLAEQLGCSLERIENLLAMMKGFDPTGVFAGDLNECLALQLEERGQLDTPMVALLENLELLGDHDFKTLADICGVNDTYLKDMVGEIQALNPKPAGEFEHLVVQTAIPDVLMKKRAKTIGGGWRVELNNDTLPRVLVNNQYYTDVLSHATQKKDKEYLSNQLSSANWLVKALDQRAQTILKVAAEIIEQQDAFFNYGIEFLKPLTLKDISTEIEMHESTVSRVTTNKYIGTPRGIFELKFFFSSALSGDGKGPAHSSEAVKARIKNMIDAEDPKKVLSDDKIVDLLKAENIDIARRTVAKYREALHIGSSVQRRKQKKNI